MFCVDMKINGVTNLTFLKYGAISNCFFHRSNFTVAKAWNYRLESISNPLWLPITKQYSAACMSFKEVKYNNIKHLT